MTTALEVKCQCGGPMEVRGSGRWCRHCDEPHVRLSPMMRCRQCVNLGHSGGAGSQP